VSADGARPQRDGALVEFLSGGSALMALQMTARRTRINDTVYGTREFILFGISRFWKALGGPVTAHLPVWATFRPIAADGPFVVLSLFIAIPDLQLA
jgi:hypothetical protein